MRVEEDATELPVEWRYRLPRILRYLRGPLPQKEFAALCQIGEKSYSTWESGARISSMKLAQFERVCSVAGHSMAEALTIPMSELPELDHVRAWSWPVYRRRA